MKNYCKEIDSAIKEYEDGKPYKTHRLEWVAERVEWCYRWKHITHKEMSNFCDRITYLFDNLPEI